MGINGPFQSQGNILNGGEIRINTSSNAKFGGMIYFTLDRNLYVLDGNDHLRQLTRGMDVRDPAVSPDGKWIAFIRHEKNYADVMYMSTDPTNTTLHTLVTGKGQYFPDANGANNFYWFAQPAWSPDGTHLLFLSDLQKAYWKGRLPGTIYNNTDFLDLQVFSLPFDMPTLTAEQAQEQAQVLAYAYYGDGGLRDPSYRPHHPQQILFTNYMYDPNTATKQLVQVMIEDTSLVSGTTGQRYYPGNTPAVALTPAIPDLVNFQPAFSPDGNFIVYIQRESSAQMGLSIMPIAEGIANDPNDPTFDPTSTNNQEKALAPYTSQSSKLLTLPMVSQPVWSPDGHHLLYYSHANNSFDLWMATLVKNNKTGRYSIKANSQVQLTQSNGHLNSDIRACWVA